MRELAKILTTRHGERLSDWMRDVDTRGAPTLRSLVAGLRTDLERSPADTPSAIAPAPWKAPSTE
jgi:hypothetical protein